MHELGIAHQMLDAALLAAKQNGSHRITGLKIEVSSVADESADSLVFHLGHLIEGTIAQGARIDVAIIPAQVQCLDCGGTSPLDTASGICPKCASANVRPVFQDEFRLVSIDVD